jgi:hypothetical protein
MINDFLEWSVNYFKHKDIFEKKLRNIKEKENCLILEYKDKKDFVINTIQLNSKSIEQIKNTTKYNKKYLVCDKNEDNLEFLIKNWNNFLIDNVMIIFINLNSNQKFIINPKVHNMIAKGNIKKSVETLFINN